MPFDPHLVHAKEQGSILTSEMEAFLKICPCRVIAVTGSDGKTTTTTIISELLKKQGFRVHLGGNIGHPLFSEVEMILPEDITVLELSSFQLHSMDAHPNIAVITNISPNHLDKHLDYKDYYDSKANIFLKQNKEDRLILNARDEMTPYYEGMSAGNISYFAREQKVTAGVFSEDAHRPIPCFNQQGRSGHLLRGGRGRPAVLRSFSCQSKFFGDRCSIFVSCISKLEKGHLCSVENRIGLFKDILISFCSVDKTHGKSPPLHKVTVYLSHHKP